MNIKNTVIAVLLTGVLLSGCKNPLYIGPQVPGSTPNLTQTAAAISGTATATPTVFIYASYPPTATVTATLQVTVDFMATRCASSPDSLFPCWTYNATQQATATATNTAYVPPATPTFTNTVYTLPVTATAQCYVNFVKKWGSYGTGNSQFYELENVVVHHTLNRVYVADVGNNRVQVFDLDGNFLFKWGTKGTGNGQFFGPNGMDIDFVNGRVFVSEVWNNRIQVFDLNGNYITKWGSLGTADGQFDYPSDIVWSAATNMIYICDGKNQVQAFTATGAFVKKWGGNGQFIEFNCMGRNSDGSRIYAGDSGNMSITVFDAQGNYITKWGSKGTGNTQLMGFGGIYSVPGKGVFVADLYAHYVKVFDENGNFINKWGGPGSADGLFNGACVPTMDSQTGLIYVTDIGNKRVQVFEFCK